MPGPDIEPVIPRMTSRMVTPRVIGISIRQSDYKLTDTGPSGDRRGSIYKPISPENYKSEADEQQ